MTVEFINAIATRRNPDCSGAATRPEAARV